MKAIIQSYSPEEVERIARGEQTIKVCKTAPKDTPFKVYVYCTKERMTRVPSMYAYLHKNEPRACAEYGTIVKWGRIGNVIVNPYLSSKHVSYGMHGKVIGEFVCDKVIKTCGWRLRGNTGWCAKRTEAEEKFPTSACLTIDEIVEYAGGEGREVCGWHISDLKIYDKPKELSEFRTVKCTNKKGSCFDCDIKPNCIKYLTRPPQSWQYVEEL